MSASTRLVAIAWWRHLGPDLTWIAGAALEDTVAAVTWIALDMPRKYPNLHVVWRLGGALPLVLARMHPQGFTLPPNVWFEGAAQPAIGLWRSAALAYSPDALLLGIDDPYVRGSQLREFCQSLDELHLGHRSIRDHLDRNAQRISSYS